jgi:hypothetical protein
MNRLADETSPYLLQHAQNPVDWYPWGDEAFARAEAEDKPVLLSIGYSACHWCHVMEHESFANPELAKILNEHFVAIKVDREERPDVDAVYMDAIAAMTGSGGWPLNVFLKPDRQPFGGGTYYPPTARHGLPAFRDLLTNVAKAWADTERRSKIDEAAAQIVTYLQEGASRKPDEGPIDASVVAIGFESLLTQFDYANGGWGTAPKFPSASALEFLARRNDWNMLKPTLDRMADGGMYDLVGGGFHRYSVDAKWLVPHFEKMLYDNAQLASVYLHGYLVTGKPRYREVAEETVDYMLRELRLEGGAFASAQDADTDGKEGLTYTWTRREDIPDEILHIFEGDRFIIRGELAPELRTSLLAERTERTQPALDDKAVTAWNGLALATLAECGRFLGRADVLDAARALGSFLLDDLSNPDDGRLYRTWRAGVAKGTGYLEDYANVAHGLLELYAATGELRWLIEARRLAGVAQGLFGDPVDGGFFDTPVDGERLIARKKQLEDNPTPSGNAMLAYVLLRLARIYGDDEAEAAAVGALALVREPCQRAAPSFGWSLVAIDFFLAAPREVVIVGPVDSEIGRAALARWEPRTVVAVGPADDVPLLEGKTLVDGEPAVYICERFVCAAPVTEAAALPEL